LAVLALVPLVALGLAGNASSVVAAGDDTGSPAYDALVQRLLTLPSAGAQPSVLQLLPSEVATQFPVNLPLPSGASVVGSAVRTSGGQVTGVTVVLDVPGTQSAVQGFYQQQLAANGWNPPASVQGNQHGFQPRPAASPQAIFCPAPGAPNWIVVMVYPVASGTNDVRLNLNTSPNQTCARSAAPQPQAAPQAAAQDPIPVLNAPDGVGLQSMGGGGGPSRWTSDATATTNQSASVLEGGFEQQLQAAGWTKADGRDDGPVSWSTWNLPSGGMQGFLYVLIGPGTDQKVLHVEVVSPSPSSGASGAAFSGGQARTAVAVAVPATGAVAPPAVPGR
jgi:hypothetical protein